MKRRKVHDTGERKGSCCSCKFYYRSRIFVARMQRICRVDLPNLIELAGGTSRACHDWRGLDPNRLGYRNGRRRTRGGLASNVRTQETGGRKDPR